MAKKPGERDYRDGRREGEPDRRRLGRDVAARRWWEREGAEAAQSIASTLGLLQSYQRPRLKQATVSARLYGGLPMLSGAGAQSRLLSMGPAQRERVNYNAVQSIIDTAVSRIGEIKPRPYFLTSGGNYRQQRKAKKLNQFVEGVFYETKTYDLGIETFKDGCIWGDGFIHVYGWAGRLFHERVLCTELWVDEVEAQYGFPRTLFRVKSVDRDELANAFPDSKQHIFDAHPAHESTALTANISDMVTVVEVWRVGSRDADNAVVDGHHAIALPGDNHMLLEPEEYPFDFFPFAHFQWCRRPLGYWGQGLAEQLQGDQIELNKELALIQRSMHLAGSFKVLLKAGSKVVEEALNNEIGATITYTDTPPQYITPQPLHEQYLNNPERIIARMYQKAGMSQMAASSQKPQGLNSGKAIRTFEDVESDRFRSVQRANDNLYLEVARLDVAIARQMAKEGKLEPVRVPGRQMFDSVDWKRDIGTLEDNDFVMQCFPISRLSKDPAGRLQDIQEYVQAGFLEPRNARRLLDFPDLESVESLANAQDDILSKVLDDIVDNGEYAPPEPTDDLQLAKEMVLEYIQRFRLLDLEPERMDLLRTWSSQVDALQQLAAPPMQAPGAPAAQPQAVAAPPPVSDMLPNAPAN